MKKVTLIIAVLALLVSSNVFAAKVSNVELFYKDGFTIAKIDVDGTVRFSHQTEEAKDGKPFRVIVDVLSATHNLGGQTFVGLPACPVKKIRSSQYSVKPEQVVRVVFDMDSERIYRIDSDMNSITITFSDKNTKPFKNWATINSLKPKASVKPAPVKKDIPVMAQTEKPKSTEQLNKSINDDRMLSLQGSQPEKPKVAKATPAKPKATPKKAVVQPTAPQKKSFVSTGYSDAPVQSTPAKKQTVVATKPKVESKPAPAKKKTVVATKPKVESKPAPAKKQTVVATKPKPESKPAPVKKQTVTASKPAEFVGPAYPAVAKAEPKKTAPKKAASQTKAESKPTPAKKQPVVAAKPKADTKKQAPTKVNAQKPADKKATTTVAKADPKAEKKSTSRFRRNPTDKKIRGTLVAEFPKRLVIKYKTTKYRDPFETLINESKTYNDPVQRRIPNVEGLRLVGIIESDDNGNRALFEDNTGYGYILKTGDKVKKGYVLRVDQDRVYFQIFEYGWSRTVSLVLES